jgi:outer membrane protein
MTWRNMRLHIFLCILLVPFAAVSGKVLTLDDCIEIAMKNNQDVIGARNQARVAGDNVWNAFGSFLPSVAVGGSVRELHQNFLFLDTFTIPGDTIFREVSGITKDYTLQGGASLTLFDGGQNIFNYLSSKEAKRYSDNLAEKAEQDLIYDVKVYYFAYLASLKKEGVSQEAVKRGEEQYKLAQSRFDVGSASKSDVLKAQVQYGNDKLDLITANNAVKVARANLMYYIGVDVNSDVEFSSEYESREYSGTEGDALKFGLSHHPGLLASEHSLAAANHNVRSVYGRYFPSLGIDVSRSWTNPKWSEVNDFRTEDASWLIRTSLSWSIFENFRRKRDLTSARASRNNARAAYEYSRNAVALNIKEAYLEIAKAKEALQVAEENVLAAEEDMSLVQEKYNLGAATILELLDAQVSLISAQNMRIEADFDYNLAVAKLENAMGVR